MKTALLATVVLVLGSAAAAEAPAKTPARAQNSKLAGLADNTAIELGALKLESPEGEGEGSANRVTDYSGMTYDPHNHRILMFGGGHATTFTDTIYSFDFGTLAWSSLYKPTPSKFYKPENLDNSFWKSGGEGPYPRPIGRHTYDLLIVPDHRKEFLLLRTGCGPSSVAPGIGYFGGGGGAYDFATGKWERFDNPFGGYGAVSEYDPISKMVIGQAGQGLFMFDCETRKTVKILDDIADKFKVSAYSGTLVYCPIDQCMYGIPDKKDIWKLELDRQSFNKSKITKLTPGGEKPPESECAFVWDPVNKVIAGGVKDNKFYMYDPAKNEWSSKEIQGAKPGTMTFHCLSYDPVDNVYIFIAGVKTWAFRLKK
jgi:hypothetical protein